MELNQIRYFIALWTHRSFSRAARSCGVAQPSVSRAIKLLEHELGGRLFYRGVEGVYPTKFSVRIEPHFRTIMENIEAVQAGSIAAASRLEIPHGRHSNGAQADRCE
jgi:LysR family transcriptional regulator, hydrogen peroxide-inducible genes activator